MALTIGENHSIKVVRRLVRGVEGSTAPHLVCVVGGGLRHGKILGTLCGDRWVGERSWVL